MPSAGTTKRISRIRRRAIPEVLQAYRQGRISARRADALLYLEQEQQLAALERLLSDRENAARRSRIAAAAIKAHIDAGRLDLAAVQEDLRTALSSSSIQTHA